MRDVEGGFDAGGQVVEVAIAMEEVEDGLDARLGLDGEARFEAVLPAGEGRGFPFWPMGAEDAVVGSVVGRGRDGETRLEPQRQPRRGPNGRRAAGAGSRSRPMPDIRSAPESGAARRRAASAAALSLVKSATRFAPMRWTWPSGVTRSRSSLSGLSAGILRVFTPAWRLKKP